MLSDAWFKDLTDEGLETNSNILLRNYFFLKNYITSEGAVSHDVLHYQHLSIARYQVNFYANIILSNYQLCPVSLTPLVTFYFNKSDLGRPMQSQ